MAVVKLNKTFKIFLLVFNFILVLILTDNVRISEHFQLDDTFIDNFTDNKFSLEILREDVTDCFFDGKGTDRNTDAFKKLHRSKSGKLSAINELEDEHTNLSVLKSFNDILSLLNVKAVIIEPSILYCMLLPRYKEILLKRRFNISDFSGSRHIITYGIMEQDVAPLQEEVNIYKFSVMGFKVHFNQAPVTAWMVKQASISKWYSFSSHIFYKHKLLVIHIVVFYKRSNYFWHAALDVANNEETLVGEKLLFTNHSGAHEKFSFTLLENKMMPVSDFYVPSNAHYFLLEIMSSRFLECNISKEEAQLSRKDPKSRSYISEKYFNRNTRIVLRELKKVFHPLLMNLWIWSGTLLGWYRQCDIIPYTTDVDFGTWAYEVEDLNLLISMLKNNKQVKLRTRMGLLEEALEFQLDCRGLQADIFFLYRIQNGSWNSGHRIKRGFYFRYYFPPFTLCSAELLGEKVQVPCESESVISAEYGPEWRKPVSSWDYETSPKNRGPNTYWDKQKLNFIHQVY